ncbi:hypothetical protein [Enterococcus faecalis]|uniref:hypothetical protein n=1 Tax=Enterococcus faecalis TaxID=1351 RepID=UPI00103986FD|nr:hypothetical protein [Enterococcus faecalis]
MNNLTTSILLVAKWWNPFSWGDALGDAIEAVQALLNNVIVTSAGFALEKMTGLFNTWGTWNIETKMHGRKANNCR